jgi:mono/diheme cytochrome c family protein
MTNSRKLTVLGMAPTLLLFFALGCGGKEEAPSGGGGGGGGAASAPTAEITPATRDLFKTRCAVCHGDSGKGDGPGAASLVPKPRDYRDAAWQASVTDEDIKKTILYGGAAVQKSPAMPASPDLNGKPELDGLVALVRSFKGQ